MSIEYLSETFSVPDNRIPAKFGSKEDFAAFATDAKGEARERPGGLHYLHGSTRSGWALLTAWNAAKAASGNEVLSFLSCKGRTVDFDDEHGNTAVSVLSPAEVKDAAARLQALLVALRANPAAVYDADEAGVFYEDDVEKALARDYVTANPRFDRQVRGDEGESADYLLTFLRSTLAVLNSAAAEGLAVAHWVRC
jgi:hypothetical protein